MHWQMICRNIIANTFLIYSLIQIYLCRYLNPLPASFVHPHFQTFLIMICCFKWANAVQRTHTKKQNEYEFLMYLLYLFAYIELCWKAVFCYILHTLLFIFSPIANISVCLCQVTHFQMRHLIDCNVNISYNWC